MWVKRNWSKCYVCLLKFNCLIGKVHLMLAEGKLEISRFHFRHFFAFKLTWDMSILFIILVADHTDFTKGFFLSNQYNFQVLE